MLNLHHGLKVIQYVKYQRATVEKEVDELAS
jgi:hypothetical protein